MPYSKDLELSPKFAEFLSGIGLLKPVVNAYKDFRSRENFPYEVKDKRIFRTAILKALCQRADLSIEDIELLTEKWTEEMYDAYPTEKVGKEIDELMEKHKIPEEYRATVAYMFNAIDKKSFDVWLKDAAKNLEERDVAENATPEQLKKIQDKKKDKALSDKLNEIPTEEMKKKPKAKKR